MTNKEMLEKIRLDRPGQVINKVISFIENNNGTYYVEVDMESVFFDTKVLHTRFTLLYPLNNCLKL